MTTHTETFQAMYKINVPTTIPELRLIHIYRLFDMDGTLVDSTAGVVGAWHTFKEKYPILNVEEILNSELVYASIYGTYCNERIGQLHTVYGLWIICECIAA